MQAEHPGRILQKAFLTPLQITPYRLSKEVGVSQTMLSQILHGTRSITPATALRLSKFFSLNEDFWLQAQMAYDLAQAKAKLGDKLDEIKPYSPK
ncbi:MAG: HigA family addiction module antitoxin [Burkholderiales bacterium]|nr:HigA family addiction module antitoxin [Burkholderiales bacterium]